jgi:hypothetical protein
VPRVKTHQNHAWKQAAGAAVPAALSWRVLLGATGTALLWPTGPVINVPGFVFFLALFAFNFWRGHKNRSEPASSAAAGHDGARKQPLA